MNVGGKRISSGAAAIKPAQRVIAVLKNVMPLVLFLCAMGLCYIYLRPHIKHHAVYLWFQQYIYYPSVAAILNIFSHKIFFVAFAAILVLERMFPAQPKQKIFSAGFLQDSVWLLIEACAGAIVIVTYTNFLKGIYSQYFSFLTIHALDELPAAVKFILSVFIADFLGWFHHWVRHKVPVFWEFHTIHHSQKELNMFTDQRYHFVEYVITRSINTFPFLIFNVQTYHIIAFALFHTWFTHFYHANIKSNFGVLRYIFVTPQSHRIHHSIEPRHHDKNFGVLFSIWDRMFGTQYRGYDEYPDTGVQDERFPWEKSIKGLNLLINPLRQHIYPFQSIIRKIKKK